jgi:phage-related protein
MANPKNVHVVQRDKGWGTLVYPNGYHENEAHARQKKTRATSKRDITLARARWSQSKEQ